MSSHPPDIEPAFVLSSPDRPTLADQLAWDGSNLVVTDSELMALIDKPHLSPSTAKAVRSCAARMVGERALPSRTDLFSPTEKGTAAHLVLEKLYGLAPALRDEDHALLIMTNLARLEPEDRQVDYMREIGADPVRYAKWISLVHSAYRGIFAIEDPKTVKVVHRELRLDGVQIGGVPFKGFIDRVDELDDGTLKVVDFKGLALDTPIPTPEGWTTMGALAIGDKVLGTDGRPTTVTIKSQVHHRPCYRLTFSDGTTVVCDNVHLWTVQESNGHGALSHETLEADDVYARLLAAKAAGHPQSLTVPNAKPLDLPDVALPIDPYVLGAWLGDGATRGSSITVGRPDAADMLVQLKGAWHGQVRVEPASKVAGSALAVSLIKPDPDRCGMGHEPRWASYPSAAHPDGNRACMTCNVERSTARRSGVAAYVTTSARRWNVGLRTLLSEAGLLGAKRVPEQYLRASRGQRLALLQGLMDTDGSWNGRRRRAVFVTTLPNLADAVAELAVSLGVNAQRFDTTRTPSRGRNKVSYRVEFRPVGFNPFRLPRKALDVDEAQRTFRTVLATRRAIVAMEPVESVPTQCIQVDAADSLYLCGPGMVPTHNTGKDKSGKPSDRFDDDHGDQIRLYVAGLEEKLGQRPSRGHLYYIEHGKQRRVAISTSEVKKSVRAFSASWDLLRRGVQTGRFAASPSFLCGWCALVNSCPVARPATSPKDPREDAASADDLGIPTVVPTGTKRDRAAHEEGVGTSAGTTEGTHVSESTWREPNKPWETDGGRIDGHLALSTPHATAVIGIAEMAAEELFKAGQKVGPSTLRALTGVLGGLVLDVQSAITHGSTDWGEGSNVRARGAVHTVIETILPIPFGAPVQEWESWHGRAVNFAVAMLTAGIDLFEGTLPADGYGPLAADAAA